MPIEILKQPRFTYQNLMDCINHTINKDIVAALQGFE